MNLKIKILICSFILFNLALPIFAQTYLLTPETDSSLNGLLHILNTYLLWIPGLYLAYKIWMILWNFIFR